MRLRTIPQAYDYYKKNDPDCAISRKLLREIAESGDVPTLKSGRKILIDLDSFDAYLEKAMCERKNGE